MRHHALDYLVCPLCGNVFELRVMTQDQEHVLEGELRCSGCMTTYPITNGIPILLNTAQSHEQNARTAARFGEEWDQFDFIDAERYAAQFLDWIAPVTPEFFKGKLVLDAGCGKGRHCIASAGFGAREIVGIDLASGSVRAAFRNTKHLPNVHIVQADLYHLPFRRQTFDYVYSVGVLHHTPNPRQSFASLVKTARIGGSISAWVYGREGNGWIIYGLNPIRTHVTSKLPLPLVKALAFVLSAMLQAILKGVYAPLNRSNTLRPIAEKYLFYNDYLFYISRFPFRENYSIVFDHLLPEIAHYIRREEFESWFAENQLSDVTITPKSSNSWRGVGVRCGDEQPC